MKQDAFLFLFITLIPGFFGCVNVKGPDVDPEGNLLEDLEPPEGYDSYCTAYADKSCECWGYNNQACGSLGDEQSERIDECLDDECRTRLEQECKVFYDGLAADPNVCHALSTATCNVSDDCEEEFVCYKNLCRPNLNQTCQDDYQCSNNRTCIQMSNENEVFYGDGVCSRDCVDKFDCRPQERCLGLTPERKFCTTRCLDQSDCLRGQQCITFGEFKGCYASACDDFGTHYYDVSDKMLKCECYEGYTWLYGVGCTASLDPELDL